MESVTERLNLLKNPKKADFDYSLSKGINRQRFQGVRCGDLRKIANSLSEEEKEQFIKELPHTYHEEDLMHIYILNEGRDYERTMKEIEAFLPYMQDWSLTDALKPDILMDRPANTERTLNKWLGAEDPFTVRTAIVLYMRYYLGNRYKKKQLQRISKLKRDEYYVEMAVAWYLATALILHKEDVTEVLKSNTLNRFTHNKTIQKAIESYRIDEDTKSQLRRMKR